MDLSALKVDTTHSLFLSQCSVMHVSYGQTLFMLCLPLKRSLGLQTNKTGVVDESSVPTETAKELAELKLMLRKQDMEVERLRSQLAAAEIENKKEDEIPDLNFPACAQWCIFSIVRANFEKYDLCSAPIARALPRYIVPFFKFFKTGKCFKTMLFPVSCVSQKPFAFQKHSLLLTQPKTHAKTLSERSEKCATVHVLMGTDNVARAKYLQRALWTLRRALYQV